MKLPYAEFAIVKEEKFTEYLLNLDHRDGGPKAKFFRKVGFSETNIEKFKSELINLAQKNKVIKVDKTKAEYVVKYVIDGKILAPDNQKYKIRTIWSIDKNKIPWLSTAYRYSR